MNDEFNLTDDQLHLATSRLLPSSAQTDSDTAAAREVFLTLGASVESAASNFDQAAFLIRLERSCRGATVTGPKAEPVRDWLTLILSGALAAAALIAIVRIAVDSRTANQQVAASNYAESPTAIRPIGMSPTQSIIAWNDSLDDELALAAATLEQFGGRRRGFDDSVLNMNEQLQSLSQELLGESL